MWHNFQSRAFGCENVPRQIRHLLLNRPTSHQIHTNWIDLAAIISTSNTIDFRIFLLFVVKLQIRCAHNTNAAKDDRHTGAFLVDVTYVYRFIFTFHQFFTCCSRKTNIALLLLTIIDARLKQTLASFCFRLPSLASTSHNKRVYKCTSAAVHTCEQCADSLDEGI